MQGGLENNQILVTLIGYEGFHQFKLTSASWILQMLPPILCNGMIEGSKIKKIYIIIKINTVNFNKSSEYYCKVTCVGTPELLPCPDRSRTLLRLPLPSNKSMAYLPLSFSVGSLILSHSCSPVTPHCTLSEWEIFDSLEPVRNKGATHKVIGHGDMVQWANKLAKLWIVIVLGRNSVWNCFNVANVTLNSH